MAYITNKTARQHYEILETFMAGIALTGTEVKSVRNGKGSLLGAKVLIRGGEAFLVGATIPPHQEKNAPPEYDPDRTRRLLFTRKEIEKLARESETKNLTLLPITVYNRGRRVKVDVAVARKKQSRDKREEIKRRESERSIRRSTKNLPE